MPNRSRPPAPSGNATGPNPDVIFAALADPVRRRLLQILTDGKPRPASQLAPSVGRRLDATLKHLGALRDAGFLLASPDPADARRQLYALGPAVSVNRTEQGMEMDFGCCVVQLT